MVERDGFSGVEALIRSLGRGWLWIVGAMVVALSVIGFAWMAEPEVFKTAVELHIIPPDGTGLGDDREGVKQAVKAVSRQIITVAMSGEVQEAVGEKIAEEYGIDRAEPGWRKDWSKQWDNRFTVAGAVDGNVFLSVDDHDGARGVMSALTLLEALGNEWLRRNEAFRQSGLARLDRLIERDMDRLVVLMEKSPEGNGTFESPQAQVLDAERELAARNVAGLRLRRHRLEFDQSDDVLPWVVVGRPRPFEHHIQDSPPALIIFSAMAFVLLVAAGWVIWDGMRDH